MGAAIDCMAVGDYIQRHDHRHGRAGKPVAPRTKAHMRMATRTFFRDCQEWEWFLRGFDPTRALALPRSAGIWNRLSSGTYFPPPVCAVEIPAEC